MQHLSIVFYHQQSTLWLLLCSSHHHQDKPLPRCGAELRRDLPHLRKPPPTYPAAVMAVVAPTPLALFPSTLPNQSPPLLHCLPSPRLPPKLGWSSIEVHSHKKKVLSIEAPAKSRVSLKLTTKMTITSKSSAKMSDTNLSGLSTRVECSTATSWHLETQDSKSNKFK